MNQTIKDNEKKWDELVISEVPCGRPRKNLTKEQA